MLFINSADISPPFTASTTAVAIGVIVAAESPVMDGSAWTIPYPATPIITIQYNTSAGFFEFFQHVNQLSAPPPYSSAAKISLSGLT